MLILNVLILLAGFAALSKEQIVSLTEVLPLQKSSRYPG